MSENSAKLQRIRRLAAKLGYRLKKKRRPVENFGKYMLIRELDREGYVVAADGDSLESIHEFLTAKEKAEAERPPWEPSPDDEPQVEV